MTLITKWAIVHIEHFRRPKCGINTRNYPTQVQMLFKHDSLGRSMDVTVVELEILKLQPRVSILSSKNLIDLPIGPGFYIYAVELIASVFPPLLFCIKNANK